MKVKQIISNLFESATNSVTFLIQQAIYSIFFKKNFYDKIDDIGAWFRSSSIDKKIEGIFTKAYQDYYDNKEYIGGEDEFTDQEKELGRRIQSYFNYLLSNKTKLSNDYEEVKSIISREINNLDYDSLVSFINDNSKVNFYKLDKKH